MKKDHFKLKALTRTLILGGALSVTGLTSQIATAQIANCTGGVECVRTDSSFVGSASPLINSENPGSLLHFTAPKVELKSASGAQLSLQAYNSGAMVFDGDLSVTPNGRIQGSNVMEITQGASVTVKGDFDLAVETRPTVSNGIIYLDDGILNIDGNANITLAAASGQGYQLVMKSNSVLNVGGKAVIQNLSLSDLTTGLNVQENSKATFNELEITTNAVEGFWALGNSSVVSTGKTTITANTAYTTGLRFNGNALVSLGDSAAVAQQMETNRAGIGQINIGPNATISADAALYMLDDTHHTVITIKGIIDSNISAIEGNSGIEDVRLQGGHIRGALVLYEGDDRVVISSGIMDGPIFMLEGNDYVEIAGGKVMTDYAVEMGEGQDIGVIRGNPDISALAAFAGGSDGTSANTGALSFIGSDMSAYSETGTGLFIPDWDTLNLTNGTRLTMTGANILSAATGLVNNRLNIDSTSSLIHDPATPSQVIVGSVNNAGHMTMGNNQAVGDTWTIQGNYVGSNGLITFDTTLGADTSPTDKLVIQGDTSGTTRVKVNNAGGAGTLTQQGIELIEVQGQSDGTFVQDGRIVAGAYDYKLGRGNAANGTDAANWYLTSYRTPLTVRTPINPTIRPEGGAYLGLMEHNRNAFSHSFHDRQLLLNNQYESSWGRVEYSEIKTRAGLDDQLRNKVQNTLLHIGTDVYQDEIFHFGVMGAYSRGDVSSRSRITGFHADGKSDGYSVGLYATWFNQDKANDKSYDGYYVDTYAQYNWFDNKVNGQGLPQESYSTNGVTLSAEAGYSFLLADQSQAAWTLEPQIQAIYNRTDGSDHWEHNGTWVDIENSSGLTGRIGLRAQRHNEEGLQPFATLNYWYNDQQETLHMSNIPVKSNRSRHLLELKIGAQTPVSENWQLYGQLQGVVGENSTKGYGANIGLKYTW